MNPSAATFAPPRPGPKRDGSSSTPPAELGGWSQDAVAVVGVGLRLPGGISSLDGLWSALIDGRDLVGEVPPDRFDADRFVSPGAPRAGQSYTGAGGFLDDVVSFDADFFGISPKESSRMDPQQRLLLECVVEALDDAGIDPVGLAGSDTAVTIGATSSEYGHLQQRRTRTANAYSMAGMATCNTANRISYLFDLHGPSNSVDTACSSALTAVHQACETLRSGRSGVALVGGVNVLLNPAAYVGFSQAAMLSPTGRCRPFSARADGYVRSEGAGVLVLKPLEAALVDGDRIHGVIAASAVNADGRTAGLALPNPRTQAALLKRAYSATGISPHEVAYVEAHGTGTRAGDPVECEALGQVLGRRNGRAALPIGSVKSNVGHLEGAAGVAGLLKALLVIRERWIPATLHAEPVSDVIDFAELGLEPVTAARPLTGPGRQVVGVNSFGFGGANAHVVLAQAPPTQDQDQEHGVEVGRVRGPAVPAQPGRLPVVVSARTPQALTEAAGQWADQLEKTSPDDFYDLAFTSSRRRARYERRIALLAADPHQAAALLRDLAAGEPAAAGASAAAVRRGQVGFAFCGNGAVWSGMGAELLATDPAFLAEVTAVDEVLASRLGWSVLEELAGSTDPARWERTEIAQPLLFAVQAGLVAALAARGIVPSAVTGHSVGEVAAAYCVGALDREAACQVILERSQAQAATAGAGRMAAVGLDLDDARQRLAEGGYADRLVVAGINSAWDVTVAGDTDALAAFGVELQEQGVFFRDLGLDYAFHSRAMDGLRGSLTTGLVGLRPTCGRVPMISTVTGGPVAGSALDGGYWWRNVREPVQFADAVEALTGRTGCDVLVEIGPHPVLGAYLRRTASAGADPVAVVATMTRTAAGSVALDAAQAHLLAVGAEVDWGALLPRRGRVVDLPAYPWQRERHWNGSPDWWLEGAAEDAPAGRQHPLLGDRQPSPEPMWQQSIEPGPLGWLADHRIGEAAAMPAAAFVDMALAAGQAVFDGCLEITGLSIGRVLTLPFDDLSMDVRLHTTLARDGAFTVASRSGGSGDWVEHSRARVRRLLRDRPPAVDLEAIRDRLPGALDVTERYANCARLGLPYGPAFQTLSGVQAGDGEVLADYAATVEIGDAHVAHPTVLDAAFQAGLPLLATALADDLVPFLAVGIEAVRCWAPMPGAGVVHLRARSITAQEFWADLTVTDRHGNVVVQVRGLQLRRFDGARTAMQVPLTEVLRAAPLPATPARSWSLPAPAEVLGDCAAELAALTERWHAHPYAQVQSRVLDGAAHFTAAAIREFLPGHDTFTVEDLLAAGVDAKHTQLLRALTGLAVQRRVVSDLGADRMRIATDPVPQQPIQTVLRDYPIESLAAHAYGVCGLHLAEVLRGEQDPLELLFSETDALAARFYDSTPVMHYHNRIAEELMRAAVAGWPMGRPLRVLEVGAGTGGLTAALLAHLPPERTHYTYTDISPAFFLQAKDRFAAFDFLDYRRLDLDTDPTDQGFTSGSFDLVIAANVLHATQDLAQTLRRVGDLLADDGHLLAIELHGQHLIPIFGLLDSFWVASDPDLRPDGPLLARDRWPALLHAHGFTGTVQTGDTVEPARSDYSVILSARGRRAERIVAAPPRPADGARPQRWLLAEIEHTDGPLGPVGEAVAARLSDTGASAVRRVRASDDAADWTSLLTAESDRPVDILLMTTTQVASSPTETTEQAVRACAVLRAVATACENSVEDTDLTLWLVTHTTGDSGCCPPATPGTGAAVWGAARSLANEQPRLTVRRIALTQLDPDDPGTAALAEHLVQEMAARPQDDEVLITPRGRFVSRVVPLAPPRLRCVDTAATCYTLTLTEPGPRYRLGWRPVTLPIPQADEVVIRVSAAGLNYRDIMTATGLVPPPVDDHRRPDVAPAGLECAGTVTAVGPAVTALVPGDRVMAVSAGCFGSHVLARADRVVPIPDQMAFAEAATLPVVLVTVQHSLQHLARLDAGETLLVHGAAGGVGLAALQFARQVGARVIATAGTPAKRDLLRLLGVEHVLDSRSLHFADQVTDLTEGEGVDVVLNSLTGEAMRRSLDLLKPHGRFLELGKRDFLADNPLPTAAFLRNLTFVGVDVGPLLTQASPLTTAHLAAIREAVRGGRYRPLPHRTYPASRIQDAFTCLQRSRHIGKIVVTFDEPVPVARPAVPPALDPQATYLVTGGLGGFGAATARHLASRGARHLTLLSRRGPDAPEASALLVDLERLGTKVSAYAGDAADPDTVRGILDDIDAAGRRLAGVVHAAMILDDAPLAELTDERFRAVLAPKMTAGHILDDLTRPRDLDFFVVYSSIAALVGNLRQSPYVAANLALEALVRDRRRAGLPALAVQWGAIADAGYVHLAGRTAEMTALGLGSLSSGDALSALDRLLDQSDADVVLLALPDWGKMHQFVHNLAAPRTAALLPPDREHTDAAQQWVNALAAATGEDAVTLVTDALTDLLAEVLQTTHDRIDRTRRLDQLGVDSLMAADFAALVRQRFGCEIAAVELVGVASLAALAHRVLTRLGHPPRANA